MDIKDKSADASELPLPSPWEDRPISEARWRHNRDTMLGLAHAGARPAEWWHYERGMPRPYPRECDALFDMGELSESELAFLEPYWREKFDRSWEDEFCYNSSGRGWLEGAAARKAWYRMFDIPSAIIRQWDKERRRSTAIVRKLKRGEQI